jgi:hypothetical protein
MAAVGGMVVFAVYKLPEKLEENDKMIKRKRQEEEIELESLSI